MHNIRFTLPQMMDASGLLLVIFAVMSTSECSGILYIIYNIYSI